MTTTSQAKEEGKKTFQPNSIKVSYLKRHTVPRRTINRNKINKTLKL